MKEKKTKGARKVLLIAVSVALVAAISVSATLAYLTAKTGDKVNTFTASGGITGQVHEPKFDEDQTYKYYPGEKVDKDPLLQNTTADSPIFAGARLDFYIDKNYNGSYEADEKVPANLFQSFVTIDDINTTDWTALTPTVNTDSLYYFYNTALKASTGDDKTDTVSGTYTANKGDCTKPIFTSVTPSKDIRIEDLGDGGAYTGTFTTSGPSGIYKNFNFKIVITGYGIKDDDTVDAATAQTQILIGLGGKTA